MSTDPANAPPQNRETFGRKDFLHVEPASRLSFLFLLGRTQVRLKPLR
jgi:hypothetical protein